MLYGLCSWWSNVKWTKKQALLLYVIFLLLLESSSTTHPSAISIFWLHYQYYVSKLHEDWQKVPTFHGLSRFHWWHQTVGSNQSVPGTEKNILFISWRLMCHNIPIKEKSFQSPITTFQYIWLCSALEYGRSSVDLTYRSVGTTGRDSQENSQWHR